MKKDLEYTKIKDDLIIKYSDKDSVTLSGYFANNSFVENIQTISDAFAHFKPKVEVDFVDEEGGSVNEVLKFNELRDFEAQGGKGNLVKNSEFLSSVKLKIDTNAKIRKSIEQNRKLREILKDATAQNELKEMLKAMLAELEENK